MKKNFLLSAALLLVAGAMAFAQPQNQVAEKQELTPEQRAENKARIISDRLLLSDETAVKFVPLYKEYSLNIQAINKKYRPERKRSSEKTDSEIDADIRKGFKKSQEILDNRIAFYEKFIKVLTPRQVREMYKIEKEQAQKAEFRKFSKTHMKTEGAAHPQH